MLAGKFDRKVSKRKTILSVENHLIISACYFYQYAMRETWLEENQRLVAIDNFGNDLPAVEAATKKHEAIETDIMVFSIYCQTDFIGQFALCQAVCLLTVQQYTLKQRAKL